MNIAKQIHGYREHAGVYQWEEAERGKLGN